MGGKKFISTRLDNRDPYLAIYVKWIHFCSFLNKYFIGIKSERERKTKIKKYFVKTI